MIDNMTSNERFKACMKRKHLDRLPIKHHAVQEIDDRLMKFFGVDDKETLLERLNDDFRYIEPIYCGPDFGNISSEHGILSAVVWQKGVCRGREGQSKPFALMEEADELKEMPRVSNDWFDYSTIALQCEEKKDYARIFGYCELDFINGMTALRGEEQTLIDIALCNKLFLKMIENKYEFVYEHIRRALEAANGGIDIVHFGEDLGSQRNILISVDTFKKIFQGYYRELFNLVHKYGAVTMLHCCGSVRKMIPTLIDTGLDILDVIQTRACGMDIEGLASDFGKDITFCGSMCVQELLPFGSVEEVRRQVEIRRKLFENGGLIIGPSHLIQKDAKIENILAMYEEAAKPFRRD